MHTVIALPKVRLREFIFHEEDRSLRWNPAARRARGRPNCAAPADAAACVGRGMAGLGSGGPPQPAAGFYLAVTAIGVAACSAGLCRRFAPASHVGYPVRGVARSRAGCLLRLPLWLPLGQVGGGRTLPGA